ncbi:hypothetical protein [Delftia deserti]|uniref:Uncharacterized protein n=1 Tax=Delftia deserti TaxID=1651218 RepID=A0ABW5EYE5_9BURK
MTTLIKSERFDTPEPLPPVPPVVRRYTVTTQVPKYGRIPVFTRAEADVILYPKVPTALARAGMDLNGNWILVHNWYKTVITGYTTVTEVRTDVIPQPQPTQPTATPVPDAWDATARSIDAFADPVRATFALGPGTRGAVRAGLTFLEAKPGTEQSHIIHGFKIESGMAYVQTQAPAGFPPSDAATETIMPARSVVPGDVMRIDVVAGVVSYFVNDQLMARGPSFLSNFPVHLGAALYTTADSIQGAAIEPLGATGRGQAQLKVVAVGGPTDAGRLKLRLQAKGGQTGNGFKLRLHATGGDRPPGYGQARLPALRAQGFGYTGATAQATVRLFSRVVSFGSDRPYSAGALVLQLATLARTEAPATEVIGSVRGVMAVLESTATFPHAGAYEVVRGGAQFEGAISPVVPHHAAGRAAAVFKGSRRLLDELLVRCRGAATFGAQRLLDAALLAQGQLGAQWLGLLLVSESLHTVGVAGVDLLGQRTVGEAFTTGATGDIAVQAGQVLQAALQALGYAGVAVGEPGRNLSVWSINTATGASSAYEGYPFNSFARIGGRYFGATADGIYELEGNDDAGQPIAAHANLGQRNFGSNRLKAWPTAYLGVSSRGHMVVRVTTERETYTYRARSSGRDMQTQRVDFGRGLRANYITLELMNECGADFDLDGIEFTVVELGRRI